MFLGKHLLVLLPHPSNGTVEAFGVVTRVWSETAVNMTVFPDFALPLLATSVTVVADRAAADEQRTKQLGGCIAYHPPRPGG
jgi:hypothetical protein